MAQKNIPLVNNAVSEIVDGGEAGLPRKLTTSEQEAVKKKKL